MKARYKNIDNTSLSACQKAVTTVEFALVCPFVFGVIFAMLEFSTFVFANVALENAVNQASRLGATAHSNQSSIARRDLKNRVERAIKDSLSPLLDADQLFIHIQPVSQINTQSPTCWGDGCTMISFGQAVEQMSYRVEYNWEPLVGGSLFPHPITISATATVFNEGPLGNQRSF